MYKAEQINFEVNKIEILNDYWDKANSFFGNDLLVDKENKVFLDDVCVKIQEVSNMDNNGYSTIRLSVNENWINIDVINNNLNPLIDELKKCIKNFDSQFLDDPCFFSGDELLEFLLRHKTIEEVKEILGDR